MGPSEYGLIALTLSVVAMFQLLANPGISTSTGKYIAEYSAVKRGEVRSLIKDSFILNIAFAIPVSLFGFFTSDFIARAMHAPQLASLLKIASLIILALSTVNFTEVVFQGLQRLEFFTFNKIILNGVKFISIFIFVFLMGYRAAGAIWGTVIGFASAAVTSNIIIYFQFFRKLPASKDSTVKTILKYSIPLAISAIAFFSYTRIDILVIGYFKNSAEVGYYNIANAIYAMPLAFTGSLVFALAPIVTTHYVQGDHLSLQKIFENSQRLALTYALPAAFGLCFIARPFMRIVLPRYEASIIMLQILSFLIIFKAVGTICSGGFLTPAGFAKIVARLTCYGAIANVILDLLLVPKYGALGAVIVTAVVHSIVCIIVVTFIIKNKLGLSLKVEFKRSLISSLLMLGMLKVYSSFINISNLASLLLIILFGVSVYLILMLFMGGIKKNDIALLRSMIIR